MASVFDDEEDEEQGTPGSRVAAALGVIDDEQPADDGADTRAGSQQDARDSAQEEAPEDSSAQQIAGGSPYEGTSNPPPDEIETSDQGLPTSDEQDAMGGAAKIQAPVAPTLTPQSNDALEAAQQLATAKSDFAGRQSRGDFKPSIGRRIAAGLAAGMVGFGTRNASEALNVGEGVTDAPLTRARRDEAARESGIQSRIDAGKIANSRIDQENKNKLQEYNLEERNMRNQGYVESQHALAEDRQSRATARSNALTSWTPKDPNNPTAGGTGRTADGKTVENVPPPDSWMKNWAKSPEGVAASLRMTVEARKGQADAIFGKGNSSDKQDWIATGKINKAASVKIPSAQLQEYSDWKKSFKAEHGRDPNASEIQGWGHGKAGTASKNLLDRILSQKNTALAKAQSDYRAGKITKDEYLNSWQEEQDNYEQRLNDATGEDIHHVSIRDNVDPNTLEWHGEAPAQAKPAGPAATPAPAKPAQQPAAQPKQAAAPAAGQTFQYKGSSFHVGQNITVGGKPAVVTGFNPKTGKPTVKIQGQ